MPPPVPESAVALAVPGRRAGWRRWLPLTLVIGFIAACAIAMLLILGFSNGIAGLVIGLIAAILPVPVLVGCFLWLDRYEPEPTRYLLFCFSWGASVATLAALGVNTGVAYLFDKVGLPDALVAVLVAPFIEESMKALGPILLLWRRRREWSGITDGIVYCGLSAVGFAMVENVLYLGGHGYAAGADEYGPATGIQNVFLIFIVRILFTGFAHPLFTSMSGIGLGISSRSGNRRIKWLAPIGGLILAMILHGTFNLLPTLSAATGQPMIMLYGYLGFMVPLFFAVVGLAISLRGWEGRLTERILPRYVTAGWFAPPEVAALGTLGRRHSARRWARRVAGDTGLKAMRSFQFASTRLALIRDGMQRGLDRKPEDMRESTAEEQRLLDAIVGYRAVFQGRDPQTPQAFWDGTNYHIAFPDGVTRTVTPPEDPVVPVPVRIPPQPVLQYPPSWPGYGAQPGGYGTPPAYLPQPVSAPSYYTQPGYAQQPSAPGYAVPGSAPGYGQPVSAPGYAQPTSAPGYAQPTSASGYGQPTSAPGYPQPGVGPGYGQPGSAPGYVQPGSVVGAGQAESAPGYAQPTSAPGYAQPTSAPGYAQPTSAPGYAQPGVGPGYGQPGSASGYVQPGSVVGAGQPESAPGYAQPGYALPGYGQPGSAPGFVQPGSAPGYGQQTPASGDGQPGVAPGYAQPASGPAPGYYTQPASGPTPGHYAQPGSYPQPAAGPGPGYYSQPAPGSAPGSYAQPTPGSAPGYSSPPTPGSHAQPPSGPVAGDPAQPTPTDSRQPAPDSAPNDDARPTSAPASAPAPEPPSASDPTPTPN